MNERDIFIEALDKSSPEERCSWLDRACGNNPKLRSRVELLLRAHEDADSMLDHPVLGDGNAETISGPTDRVPPQPPEADLDQDEIALDFLEPSEQPDHIGRLGQFQVREAIGHGGMGVVLKANDPKLNRIVAIKVLASHFAANATARKRFLREARAAAAVTHPHVIAIYAVDEDNTPPYLVMECVDGQSLQQKIDREGELELKEILRIGSQIAAGLAAAHAHGLIHRDIKPANILLENGVERVKITDFGLARAIDDLSITRTGEVPGTPQYMSPEQASGQGVDNRSDLFSLGCVLYAMCTGRSPFRGDSTVAVLRRVCDDVHRPIGEINPEIPDALVAIIDRLLAKNPDERFQTAQEVADLLEQHLACLQYPTKTPPRRPMGIAAGSVVQPGPGAHDSGVDKASVPRRSHSRRRPWAVAAIVLLALVGSLGMTEATGVTRLAATVIRIATGEGTLVIEVDDPTVEVSIDGEDVSIRGAGVEELRLRPGEYQLRAMKDGKPIKTELVTISRGGREVVRVTMELPVLSDAKSQWMTPGAPDLATSPFDAQQARKHQEEWAEHLSIPVEYTNSIGMKFRLIPPGEFMMGSPEAERQRAFEHAKAAGPPWAIKRIPTGDPQHRVRITKPFYLGVYEVTQEEYERVMGTNPSHFSRAGRGKDKVPGMDTSRFPVDMVSWHDAVEFCRRLSAMPAETSVGRVYRLLTEAEWEYACRAGTTTPFHFGSQLNGREANCKGEYPYGTETKGPYLERTTTVGSYQPNAFGLYDMHGNVAEWCQVRHSRTYFHYSPSEIRVIRSGNWTVPAWHCRSARWVIGPPDRHGAGSGFRVALVPVDASGR